MHPITELKQYLAECAQYARSLARPEELVTIEPAQAITQDAAAREQAIADMVHKAKVTGEQALGALDCAMADDSEAGAAISRNEAAKLRRLIARTVEIDHDAAELATL